jgi:hypothetical protein
MWNEPLVKFDDADDPIFNEYKSIIAPTHLTPREALAVAYNKEPFCVNPAAITPPSWIDRSPKPLSIGITGNKQ